MRMVVSRMSKQAMANTGGSFLDIDTEISRQKSFVRMGIHQARHWKITWAFLTPQEARNLATVLTTLACDAEQGVVHAKEEDEDDEYGPAGNLD